MLFAGGKSLLERGEVRLSKKRSLLKNVVPSTRHRKKDLLTGRKPLNQLQSGGGRTTLGKKNRNRACTIHLAREDCRRRSLRGKVRKGFGGVALILSGKPKGVFIFGMEEIFKAERSKVRRRPLSLSLCTSGIRKDFQRRGKTYFGSNFWSGGGGV